MDLGAEAFVLRRPELPALLSEVNLTGRQRVSTGARPLIYSRGRLHPLPTGTVVGIPSSAASMARLVDEATLARIDAEPRRPLHWVDPLLSGVYAGSAATIGLRAAAPTVAGRPGRRAGRARPPAAGPGRGGPAATRRAGMGRGRRRPRRRGDPGRPGAGGRAAAVVLALAVPGDTAFPDCSGVLVATGERLRAKAITLSSKKWGTRADVQLLRLSFGRFGDQVAARTPLADLAAVFGLDVRHGGVGELRAGGYLDGIGVPACVGAAGRAVEALQAEVAP